MPGAAGPRARVGYGFAAGLAFGLFFLFLRNPGTSGIL